MTDVSAEHVIRAERPADVAAIRAVTEAAFRDKPYAGGNEADIVDALREAGQLTLSLVAEDAAASIVGHVAISPVSLSDGSEGWFGLGPVSVAPATQRRGVGSALVRAALEAIREGGARGCVLLGDPTWYARFGFVQAAPLVLPPVPAEYLRARVFAAPVPSATVTFHEAFHPKR